MVKKTILIRNAAAADFGGAERVPVFLARELQPLGVDAIVLSGSKKLLDFAQLQGVKSKKSPWLPIQNWSGIRVFLIPFYVLWQLFLYVYYVTFFSLQKPGSVHLQSKDDFIAGTLAAKTLGITVLWSDYADLKHVWMNGRIWYKNPVGKLVYWAARFVATIIVVSENDMKDILEQIPAGQVSKKLRVIYNGAFDFPVSSSKNDIFTYISTGRLVTDKGIGELILAFRQLHKRYPDTQLLLVGDGPERKNFERLAKDDTAIKFLGYQPEPLGFLSSSHVFVLPTYHEGFSLALVEASMIGLAIIATDVGGNPEIITHKKNGLLVKPKDIDDLFAAMVRLRNESRLRNNLARNARKKYEDAFDFKKIIRQDFLPLYVKVVK